MLACCLVGAVATAVSQQEYASHCLSKDLVSLVQGRVQIHRDEVERPSIIDILENNSAVGDMLGDATDKLLVDPLVKVLGGFDEEFHEYDKYIQDMWRKGSDSADNLASTIDRYLNVSVAGVTDSAAVNTVLMKAIQTIEQVSERYRQIADIIDDTANFFLDQLSTVGFKNPAKSMSKALASAIEPIHQTADKLDQVKKALQEGAQPWTSNADTDRPLQEALDYMKEAVSMSLGKKLVNWFQSIVDKISEASETRLGGLFSEQADKITAALSLLIPHFDKMLYDLTGGLSSFGGKLEKELRKVKAVTEKAVTAKALMAKESGDRSAAVEPRSLSIAVGALALLALIPVIA